MKYVLPFVSLMKEIGFVTKLQIDTLKILCRIFENQSTVYEDNKREITLSVSPQMKPRTKHITIKNHHFQSFIVNGDVDIKNVDNKEQIANIFLRSC